MARRPMVQTARNLGSTAGPRSGAGGPIDSDSVVGCSISRRSDADAADRLRLQARSSVLRWGVR